MSQKCVMEGWLTKKKGKEKSKLFSNENRRYFRIQELKGEVAELAFAYSYSPKDRDTKGFIYLRDITEIYDDLKSFTVVSAARTMTNEAPLPQEHLMWVQTLANYCPFADTTNIQSKISFSKKHLVLSTDKKEDDFLSRDAPISGKSYENSMSLFSRQADGETQSSFYLPSQGIHKVNSMGSNNSDIEESDGQRPTIRQLKSSDNYNFDISNDNTDETNVNGHHRHSLISNDNDVDREMSGIAGDAPYDTDRYNNYNNGNNNGNNRSNNNSREGHRDSRERRDNRELSGDHSARSGSGNRMSGDSPARRELSGRQEDHRLQSNRAGGHNGNTTNRLHQHITHTNNTTIPASNSNNQLNNSNNSTNINGNSNNNSISGRGGPTAGVVRSNGLKHNFPSMEIEEMSLDVKPLTINKAAIRRNERTGSNDYNGSGNSTNRSRSDSDPDDTMPDRGNPRKATPRRYIPALHDNSSAEEDNSGENDHNAHRNREDKSSDGTGGATPISSTNSTNNTNSNTANNATTKPKPKMNMPSSAPPRRARDSLQTVEAAINGDGSSGPTKTRQSLDELLSRKGIKTNSNPDLIAESKTDSNAPSYRNPISDTPTINTSVNGTTAGNRGGGAKRGHGNNSDSDEDADIDFKAELRARRSAASSVDETNNPSGLTMGMTTSTSSNSVNNTGNNTGNNTNNTSKPPRAPVSKSPYTPGHAPPQQVNNNYPNRVGTPPRRPQDPGSKIDSNFVNDNWDEDDEDLGDSRQNLGRLSNKAEEKYNENSGKNNRNESKVVSSGVRSDENWLNEDFDD